MKDPNQNSGAEHVAREAGLDQTERLDMLRELFPEAFAEGKVDWDKLRATLGEEVSGSAERYSFSWAGKRDAIRLLQMPSRATLVPAPDESVDWDTTKNAFIEGDNLEVLKLLLKPYYGRVKMIYIDPPYNKDSDQIYQDDFSDPLHPYLVLTGQLDEAGNALTSNLDTVGRKHSGWLSFLFPRLFLARQLLREDGVLFVSIDDTEVHNLRMVLNEIFGEESFIGTFIWQSKKGGGSDSGTAVTDHEYVICFGKNSTSGSIAKITLEAEELDKQDDKGHYRLGRELNKWGSGSRREDRPTMWFPIPGPDGKDVFPLRNDGTEGRWRWGKKRMQAIAERGDIEFVKRKDGSYIAFEKIRTNDPRFKPYRTWLTDVGTTAEGSQEVKQLFGGKKVFDFPKPIKLMKHLLAIGSDSDDDIVLDFFAGSGTIAQAVLEANRAEELHRSFVCIQLQEPTPELSEARKAGYSNIAELGRERVRRVIQNLISDKEKKLELSNGIEDLGMRAFTLTESNYKRWTGVEGNDAEQYAKQLEAFADPLADGWKSENVIYEVALKEGFGLSLSIAKLGDVKSNEVFRVFDPDKGQSFVITLDAKLDPQTVKGLELSKDDLFICRDSALTDEQAANLALQCRLKTV